MLYIINTSFFVEPLVVTTWLELMNRQYIPQLRERGYSRITFSRLLSEQIEERFTYSLMVEVESMREYKELSGEVFNRLYLDYSIPLFGDDVTWLTTVLKKLDHTKQD